MNDNITVYALKITQPLGEFFILKLSALLLLEVCFSEELQYIDKEGKLKGSQRKSDEKRLKQIGEYIDSVEMAFPNSIILAANYTEYGELLKDNTTEGKWEIELVNDDLYRVTIPRGKKLAAIIDGQHRIKGFHYSNKNDRLNTELPVSVYFDLPNPYQAFLFATINGNQTKVNRSLALEQFGFNVSEEPRKSWTPEKLAVFFSRRLNIKESPFQYHIKVAPRDDKFLVSKASKLDWYISTATIVDGIIGLISKNAKRDRVEMQQEHLFKSRSREQLRKFEDSSPLRNLFLESQAEADEKIYKIIITFFDTLKNQIWQKANTNSYIMKTVGIQASFDFLKEVLLRNDNIDKIDFSIYIGKFLNVDFGDNYFQASGIGRSRIRNLMLVANSWHQNLRIKDEDKQAIRELL